MFYYHKIITFLKHDISPNNKDTSLKDFNTSQSFGLNTEFLNFETSKIATRSSVSQQIQEEKNDKLTQRSRVINDLNK